MLDGSAAPLGGAGGAALQAPAPRGIAPAMTIYEGTPSWKAWFWSYVLLPVTVLGLFWLASIHAKRTSVRYRITSRSIDYEVGVFSRRVETVPLWRVIDLEYQQSFMGRLLGVATINVVTKDPATPRLEIHGLPASREIFDRLRDACEVQRQQRVVEVV
jgi:membrane protein YdbS with pleckstrin-like domain